MTRWSSIGPEGQQLKALFDLYKQDTTRGADPDNQDPKYIKSHVWDPNPIFHSWEQKYFYVNYRNLARDYATEIDKSGKRGEYLYYTIQQFNM